MGTLKNWNEMKAQEVGATLGGGFNYISKNYNPSTVLTNIYDQCKKFNSSKKHF